VDTPKRRLPVLQSAPAEDDAPARRPWPTWQWVAFGALAIFTAWIPLAALGTGAGAAFGRWASPADELAEPTLAAEVGATVVFVLTLGVGAVLGGLLLGRWGPAHVGLREAALAALLATLVAGAVTWVSAGVSLEASAGVFLLALVAAPAAALGAALGIRGRLGRRERPGSARQG
jgi:hypothetical protein